MKAFTGQWKLAVILFIVAGTLLLALSGYLNTGISSALGPVFSVQAWLSSRYLAVYEFLTVPR